MAKEWSETVLLQMIADQVEENLTLDYKAANALKRDDASKKEITKDVSAMANSAGGIIIYGIGENRTQRHLPEKVDPIEEKVFTKEMLEHVINTIRPRIPGVSIIPVRIGSAVVYVVEIPQGTTAHQAIDNRYYRRYNFESIPMADHEIRDVMSRVSHPKLSLTCEIHAETRYPLMQIRGNEANDYYFLKLICSNAGKQLGHYLNGNITIPIILLDLNQLRSDSDIVQRGGNYEVERSFDNTERDEISREGGFPRYGPSWYRPILPGMRMEVLSLQLTNERRYFQEPLPLRWTMFVDNAVPESGVLELKDSTILDKRPFKRRKLPLPDKAEEA
ncbi:MAG: helix-turn-helix domain-containing protein [Verrucomicrobiales bacterium]